MEGTVLAGRYRLLQKLGQGGMGSVWRAQHLELGTQVAVKLIDPNLATHSEGLTRFRREAQAAASLQSPHVVNVFDYGVDGDVPFIAMELLRGESLAHRLTRVGRLSPEATTTILLQVARAIGKAHDAGIVHRDLKPDNIFLTRDEELEVTKVLDFGIAKHTGLDSMLTGAVQTQTGAMLGTPFYTSPEQAGGKKDIDHRTDIWSFGVIACECVTGVHIFKEDTLGALVLSICTGPIPVPSQVGPASAEFDAWFARCVARERSERYQSIREAAAGLAAACLVSAPGLASPPDVLQVSDLAAPRRASLPNLAAPPAAEVPPPPAMPDAEVMPSSAATAASASLALPSAGANSSTVLVPQITTTDASTTPPLRSTQPGPTSLTLGSPQSEKRSRRRPQAVGAALVGAGFVVAYWIFGRHAPPLELSTASPLLAASIPAAVVPVAVIPPLSSSVSPGSLATNPSIERTSEAPGSNTTKPSIVPAMGAPGSKATKPSNAPASAASVSGPPKLSRESAIAPNSPAPKNAESRSPAPSTKSPPQSSPALAPPSRAAASTPTTPPVESTPPRASKRIDLAF